MAKELKPEKTNVEIRGNLNEDQKAICRKLTTLLKDLEGIKIQAIGVKGNLVAHGGVDSPGVWFTVEETPGEYFIGAVLNTFRNKEVAVVSDYSFPNHKSITAHPFGATLGKFILPEVEI